MASQDATKKEGKGYGEAGADLWNAVAPGRGVG